VDSRPNASLGHHRKDGANTNKVSKDFYQTSILPIAAIIIKICKAYTNSQEDFEDYYQEVCLQIWRSRDNFREQCKWSTWVYRISLNVCLTLLKKRKSKGRTYFTSDVLPDVMVAENKAFEDESLNQLYVGIRCLSEVDRALILLYLEEKSYQEIADILGTTANNIGVRVNRIKERLKKLLY
jgi:RNA polymerase sigma-70 factor, ECF subfamily